MEILSEQECFNLYSFMVDINACEHIFRNAIPQRVYVLEEMAEVAKELCKDAREKGDSDHIVEEEIDLLTTLFVDLRRRGVSFDDIFKRSQAKVNRAMDRFYASGEL